MFCTHCGTEIAATARYCPKCGAATPNANPTPNAGPAPGARPAQPLMRDIANKKIAGVCAGLARYFDWDTSLVRIAFVAGIFVSGIGLLGYLIGWIVMPRDDDRRYAPVPPAPAA